jgi:tetratricopeptide (TPR) repeat protein
VVSVNLWTLGPVVLGWIKLALGRPDEAVKLGEEGLRRARQLKQALSITSSTYSVAALRYERHEPKAARELAEAAIAVAEENGFPDFLASARAIRAWARSELGQAVEGVAELEEISASLPYLLYVSKTLLLAKVYLHVKRFEEALRLLDEELARCEQLGAHQEEAELYRLKGAALLGRSPAAVAEAENNFRKAIEVARGQSAKWWELHATVSLARLLRNTNRRAEARTMLADIYNWFTEGFDTADLKDAKALLDELSN